MHRGPQAANLSAPIPQQQFAAPVQHHAPNAALLIDFDNVTMGIRSDLGHELRNLLSSDIIKGKVAVQRAYADWRRYPQYIVTLAESSIDMIMAPAYGSSKKNATDIRLAVDAMELVFTRPEIGTYILLSGDSDFASLVIKLKEYGKYVIGVGIRESSSDLLVMNCDEYYSYNALAGLVKANEEETTKKDPWELVVEAIHRMKRNGDVMRSDRLKQVMQEIDSSLRRERPRHGEVLALLPGSRSEGADQGLAPRERANGGGRRRGRTVSPRRRRHGERRPRRASAAAAGDEGRRAADAAADAAASRERDENTAPRAEIGDGARDRARAGVRPLDADDGARRWSRSPTAHPPRFQSDDAHRAVGDRLSRDEAFTLVRRAVESLSQGPEDPVPASRVRDMARDAPRPRQRDAERALLPPDPPRHARRGADRPAQARR